MKTDTLGIKDKQFRLEILKKAFVTATDDSVRGIYQQAQRLCQNEDIVKRIQLQRLRMKSL